MISLTSLLCLFVIKMCSLHLSALCEHLMEMYALFLA
uniref:Uncharacterized protein n=1 Tax=Phakopsora pachyrhizi TaxID=170000 RepID=A0A0S1MJB4_PHAPC